MKIDQASWNEMIRLGHDILKGKVVGPAEPVVVFDRKKGTFRIKSSLSVLDFDEYPLGFLVELGDCILKDGSEWKHRNDIEYFVGPIVDECDEEAKNVLQQY